MRVTVVDLQGQVEVLGQGNVCPEGLALDDDPLFTGAEEIQAALPDGDDDVGVRPERLLQAHHDLLERLGMVLLSPRLEPVGAGLAHPGVQDGLVGVHGQGHAHSRQLTGQGQALLPGGDLAGGGHHAGHAHGGGALDQLRGAQWRLGAGAAGVRRDR